MITPKTVWQNIKKVFDPETSLDLQNVVGWHSIGGSRTYGFYQDQQYENGYSSISKLGNGFAQVEPYTVDKSGKSVPSNILDRIYTPNTDMSAFDFREALAVMFLVHDKVRIRVHYKGNLTPRGVNPDRITGFTFMEDYNETIVGGSRRYKMSNGDDLTDAEVITLKSINPDRVTGGFSASHAARRWTRLDDYIADYQRGFFENGAVPSGQMVITAKTATEYNDIVDMMQRRHKGASKNNNITYTHRPTDQTGKPMNSQIEWIPNSSRNTELGLKDLFENINKKIDSTYGVPASIRGVNDQNSYASVRVDEVIFVKYALNPMTLKIWSKFTHELNRITGGAGVAISYELEIPQIADEEKVKAEAKSVKAATLTTLVTGGYDPKKAIEYIETGNLQALELAKLPEEDEVEILTEEEAKDTPDQPIDAFTKSFLSIQKYFDDKFERLVPETKQLDVVDRQFYINRISNVIRSQMFRQVERAIDKLDEALKAKAYGDTTQQEDKLFTAEMLATMLPLIAIYGNRAVNVGMHLIVQAGLATEGIQRFEFTPAQRKAYERYLAKVGTSYADQTAEQIRAVLGQGILDGATKQEIEARLKEVILGPENEYRVIRLSKSEINLAEGKASVSAMENIQDQTGYRIYKVWNVSSASPCEFCQELDGSKTLVDENFVNLGDDIHGVDGGVYANDFSPTDTADAHPNCNCYTTYEVERG